MGSGSVYLLVSAAASALAALAHLAVIAGGPAWYRFFGAGEGMARLAAAGSVYPAAVTLVIACMLGTWAAYAASAAGLLPRLPLLRGILLAITVVYLSRGLGGFVLAAFAPGQNGVAFWVGSSLICLAIGAVHAVGLSQRWSTISGVSGVP